MEPAYFRPRGLALHFILSICPFQPSLGDSYLPDYRSSDK